MDERLTKYTKPDGYIDLEAIYQDLHPDMGALDLTFSAFFDDDAPELVRLGRAENTRIAAEKAEDLQRRADEAEARFTAGTQTREDYFTVVAAKRAKWDYDDPEENGPTGITWRRPRAVEDAADRTHDDLFAEHSGLL